MKTVKMTYTLILAMAACLLSASKCDDTIDLEPDIKAVEADTGTGDVTDIDVDIDTDTGGVADTDVDIDADTGAGDVTDIDVDIDADTGVGDVTDIDVDIDTDTGSVTDIDLDESVPDGVDPCWQTDNELYSIAVDVADDGAVLVANMIDESSSQLNWYTASGAPDGVIPIVGPIEAIQAMTGKNALVSSTVETYYIEDGVQERESSTFTIARIGADGATVWSEVLPGRVLYNEDTLGGGDRNASYIYDVGPDNTITLLGAFSGTLVLGKGGSNETTLDAGGEQMLDAFIARYSPVGGLLYAKKLDAHIMPSSIIIAEDGSVYVTGDHPIDSYSVEIAAFSPDGDLIWMNVSEEPIVEHEGTQSAISQLSIASDGSVVMGGRFSQDIVFPDSDGTGTVLSAPITQVAPDGSSYSPIPSFFLVRYSAQGELLFAKSWYENEIPPWATTDGGYYLPMTLIYKNQLVVVGVLVDEGVFGKGEAGETTLSAEVGQWFIAGYNLDGTLDFATYLQAPEEANELKLAGVDESPLVGVFDDLTPIPSQTITAYCF